MEKLEKVFTTWDNIEAGFVKSVLESNEIECFVNNLYYASMALTGSSAAPISIMVQPKDKEKAEEIVKQYYEDIKNNGTAGSDDSRPPAE